jgi:uncharacterized protein YkwD
MNKLKREKNTFYTLIAGSILVISLNSWLPENGKKEAYNLYQAQYYNTRINQIPWNGSVSSCDPGKLPENILRKAETRINYFRKVTGLNPIKLSGEFNDKAQHAALLMTANGQISHNPSSSWKCYTEKGYEGAMNSNLGIADFENFQEISFITGFMLDYGAINHSIGHRKWLLNSRTETMGYGATGKHEIIYVTGVRTEAFTDGPEYIAYPPAGYFPYSLIFEKWSFAIPNGKKVSYKKTKVEMLDSHGNELSTKILSMEDPWYFDPAIVWQAEDLFSQDEIKYVKNSLPERGFMDKAITVRISQVTIDEKKRDFEYQVIPFDPGK